jgi:hypothetical protein
MPSHRLVLLRRNTALNDKSFFNRGSMKITYTQFVADPALRGTTTNLPAHIAQVLIAQGAAKAEPMPARGSAGWLAARNEQAATATVPDAHDTVAGVAGVEWGIHVRGVVVAVIKRVGSDTFFFDAPPVDCPLGIVQQFLDAANLSPEANAVAIAAAKKAQEEQARKDKWAGQGVVRKAIFGSKPL